MVLGGLGACSLQPPPERRKWNLPAARLAVLAGLLAADGQTRAGSYTFHALADLSNNFILLRPPDKRKKAHERCSWA